MEYRKIKHKRHYVYDDENEFRQHHPEVKIIQDWKLANEGDWVLSDDNRILQILKKSGISHPNDRKNYKHSTGYIRTVVGTFLVNSKSYMDADFDSHNNRYTFSKTIKNTNSRIRERENVTRKEKQFATNYVIGMGGTKAFMEAFNEIDNKVAGKKAAILLKQERVMKEIEKGALDVAKSLGIDHEYVLNKLKSLADYSEDDNIILQSAKELAKIIGTTGTIIKKETGIVGLFQGFTKDELQIAASKEVTNGKEQELNRLQDKSRES